MELNITIKGLDAVASRLDKVSADTQTKLKDAMKSSVRDIQERARKNHRYITRTGEAERSIKTSVSFARDDISGIVGTTRKITVYLHQGTKRHTIVPRRKMALRWTTGSKFIFAKRVSHPGTKKDPFIFNAVHSEQRHVISRFEKAVQQAIGEAY